MHESQYEENGKGDLADEIRKSQMLSNDLNFIYTPGIGSRSIKTSSPRNSISPKCEIDSDSEGDNVVLSRQIIEEFILQHSSPAPGSATWMDTGSTSPPPSTASFPTSIEASSQDSRTQLSILERNEILTSDARIELVQPESVKCGKCKEWVEISQTSLRGWENHVIQCFNVNHLTPLQIARRVALAGDIRVTAFGPRHVECAFCSSRVLLQGGEDYTLESWEHHVTCCRGWEKESNPVTQHPPGQSQSDAPSNQRSTTRAECHHRAKNRGLSASSRTDVVGQPFSTRAGLRSSAIRRRLRNTTIDQPSAKPSNPINRRYQRKGSSKRSRAGGGLPTTATTIQFSPRSTSASPHRENNQPAPEVNTTRLIDTRPSANTRARAVAYTRPEYLKQDVRGRGRWT